MEYFSLIQDRTSIRAYKNDPVEKEKLNKIFEAARLAPTAANRQAFKILAISTAGHREELKKIYSKDWFVQAPVVLGVFSIPEKNWTRFDGKNFSDIDAAIVMDHIVLAATDLGLGTCWIGAFNSEAAKELAGFDRALEPVAFTPVGYPGSFEAKKIRKPIEDILVFID